MGFVTFGLGRDALMEVKPLVTSDCDTDVSRISNIVTDHVATSFQ